MRIGKCQYECSKCKKIFGCSYEEFLNGDKDGKVIKEKWIKKREEFKNERRKVFRRIEKNNS